jgi:hypothetical protein
MDQPKGIGLRLPLPPQSGHFSWQCGIEMTYLLCLCSEGVPLVLDMEVDACLPALLSGLKSVKFSSLLKYRYHLRITKK